MIIAIIILTLVLVQTNIWLHRIEKRLEIHDKILSEIIEIGKADTLNKIKRTLGTE